MGVVGVFFAGECFQTVGGLNGTYRLFFTHTGL